MSKHLREIELRDSESRARQLGEKLDEAIREEFFGYLLKLRSEAQNFTLRKKVSQEAKQSADILVAQITKNLETSK